MVLFTVWMLLELVTEKSVREVKGQVIGGREFPRMHTQTTSFSSIMHWEPLGILGGTERKIEENE